MGVEVPAGPAHGLGQPDVLARHVIKAAVGFHVLHLQALGVGEGIERSQLVLHIGIDLVGGSLDLPAAEAQQIGKARVSSHSHMVLFGHGHGFFHHQGITGVPATGNVHRGHMGNHFLIQSDAVGAKAFAQVTVQIDAIHKISPL